MKNNNRREYIIIIIVSAFTFTLWFSYSKYSKEKKIIINLNEFIQSKNRQYEFNKDNLCFIKEHLNIKEILKKNKINNRDTILIFYFTDNSCMGCVSFELANNVSECKNKILIVANILSDRRYKELTKEYNLFDFYRDTNHILNLIDNVFYIKIINKKVNELFIPNKHKNIYTKMFLTN